MLNNIKGKLGESVFGTYGRVNHKIFIYDAYGRFNKKHFWPNKKKRNKLIEKGQKMNITLYKKKSKWPVNIWKR